MLPADFALVLYRGDSYAARFRFWTDAAKTQPFDLTGITVSAEMDGPTDVALVCTVTLPNLVDLTIDPEAWAASSGATGTGRWDMEFATPDGGRQSPVAGRVTVCPDVVGRAEEAKRHGAHVR